MSSKKIDRKFLEACRLAVQQLVKERDAAVCELVLEEAEDEALGKLTEKSLKGPRVSEAKIMKILKGKK